MEIIDLELKTLQSGHDFQKSRSNDLEDTGQGQRSSHATHLLMLVTIRNCRCYRTFHDNPHRLNPGWGRLESISQDRNRPSAWMLPRSMMWTHIHSVIVISVRCGALQRWVMPVCTRLNNPLPIATRVAATQAGIPWLQWRMSPNLGYRKDCFVVLSRCTVWTAEVPKRTWMHPSCTLLYLYHKFQSTTLGRSLGKPTLSAVGHWHSAVAPPMCS